MTDKILIDPGPSEAGWHRIQSVLKCPTLYNLSKDIPWEDSDPLVKGSLLHVGLAHLFRHKQRTDKGKTTDKWYNPVEAVIELARRNKDKGPLWAKHVPQVLAVLAQYQIFWAGDTHWRVIAVEKELRVYITDTERWEHCEDIGGKLWTKAETMAWMVLSDDEVNPFTPAKYLYTQRADLIVQDRKTGMVYIVDHKTTSRAIGKSTRRFSMSGQFIGYRMFGILYYKEAFGGVVVDRIKLSDPLEFQRAKLDRVVDSHAKLKTSIIQAERLIREYQGKEHWPHALQETACWAYGECQMFKVCQYGPVGETDNEL